MQECIYPFVSKEENTRDGLLRNYKKDNTPFLRIGIERFAMQPSATSAAEQLSYSTLRLECFNEGEQRGDIGTGFLFNFRIDANDVVAIITNKHVVKSYNTIRFRLNLQTLPSNLQTTIPTIISAVARQEQVVRHPEESVDLCAVLVGNVLNTLQSSGIVPRVRTVSSMQLPNAQQWNEFSSIEEVTIIGYPSGIWDQANNLPIMRRGITATLPKNDYEGRREFLIDAVMIPGSSGSPVYLFNEGTYSTPNGIVLGSRLLLLGIATRYWYLETNGNSSLQDIPSGNDASREVRIPINLGLVIKSNRIPELESGIRIKVSELTARAPHSSLAQ